LDNASSNDVAVDRILHVLYPEMSEGARKRRRLRCLAHVTNLVAKAFYLGPKADDIVTELLAAERRENRKYLAKARCFGTATEYHSIYSPNTKASGRIQTLSVGRQGLERIQQIGGM
jgi:hypothetical protein